MDFGINYFNVVFETSRYVVFPFAESSFFATIFFIDFDCCIKLNFGLTLIQIETVQTTITSG